MNTQKIPHPSTSEIRLVTLLQTLGNPTRLEIVGILASEGEQPCGPLAARLELPLSTLSNHLRLLRESGATRSRRDGTLRLSSMRTDDLEARFPGLIGAILAAESNGTDKLMR